MNEKELIWLLCPACKHKTRVKPLKLRADEPQKNAESFCPSRCYFHLLNCPCFFNRSCKYFGGVPFSASMVVSVD